jgi:predicted GNAT family N-acyltransferase
MELSLSVRYRITPVSDTDEMAKAHSIRRQVFIIGQNVPESVEMDEFDHVAYHILCSLGDEVVGTGRIHFQKGEGKIGRVAVLDKYRGQGMGRAIVHHLVDHARAKGTEKVFANVQLDAVQFYEKLGFIGGGDTFMEGGIEHIRMFLKTD